MRATERFPVFSCDTNKPQRRNKTSKDVGQTHGRRQPGHAGEYFVSAALDWGVQTNLGWLGSGEMRHGVWVREPRD